MILPIIFAMGTAIGLYKLGDWAYNNLQKKPANQPPPTPGDDSAVPEDSAPPAPTYAPPRQRVRSFAAPRYGNKQPFIRR